ncbi:hypothetical protein ACFIQF_08175 [Comamonas sp. J-3]|uniref:hypothetical protein n=1 Tax=Comamonas trifloxystrobinivorans TaxID=3350256 RepID=UPI00372C1A34
MRLRQTPKIFLTSLTAALALAACGGGGSDSFSIGGEVAGLASGQSVVLSNNGSESLAASSNGAFAFKNKIESGKTYEVTVATQPSGQSCTVTNGSGTANGAVSNIRVQCADIPDSAACFDNPQLLKAGNRYSIITPQTTTHFSVGELTTFHDYAAVQTWVTTEIASGYSFINRYTNITNGMSLDYGRYLQIRVVPVLDTYNVPGRGFPISLKPSQTYTAQGEEFAAYNPQPTGTWRDTVTYLGREPVTTSFGTFETCRLRYTSQGNDGVLKTWDDWRVAVGKFAGLSVQQTTETGTTQPTNITVSWE